MSLLGEFRRRKVYKVAIVYAGVAWLLLQLASMVFEPLGIPPWAFNFLLVIVALGFPLALILAWAFELTPEGLQRGARPDPQDIIPLSPLRIVEFLLIGALCLAVGYLYLGTLKESHFSMQKAQIETAASSGDEALAVDAAAPASRWNASVAVLPFTNMSSDGENEYFSDGISEELLNVLAKMEGLKVPARTSSFFFKNKNQDIKEIGRILGVEHVLEGSVRKAGLNVRITAQLIDVSDGAHLWSETYDRKLDDIFAVQDEIAQAIARQLEVELGLAGKGSGALLGTNNAEAYDYYLKASHIFIEGVNPASLQKSMANLKRAQQLDPQFATAYAAEGFLWFLASLNKSISPFSTRIEAAYTRALSIDPDNVDALLNKASYESRKNWDWLATERVFLRALRLDDKQPRAHIGYAMSFVLPQGRVDEAQEHLNLARELDPLLPQLSMIGLAIGLASGNYAQVLKVTKGAAIPWAANIATACAAYFGLQNKAGVAESLERLRSMVNLDGQQIAGCELHYHLLNNDPAAARAAFERRAGLLGKGELAYVMGNQGVKLGDLELAMDWFEKAFAAQDARIAFLRVEYRNNEALWAHPRYQALLQKMNLDDGSLREMGYLE
ncbi:MAG: hypothetical protein V7754_19005 [Halioglobus sp.]